MSEIQHYYLPNCGYLLHEMPDDVLRQVRNEVASIEKNFEGHQQQKHNAYLAGHIRHQYLLQVCVPSLAPYVEMLAREYQNRFNYHVDECLEHRDSWVNFQSRTEFNPPHVHDGRISYVAWLKIPYDIDQELSVYNDVNGDRRTSRFEFIYPNTLGNQITHGFQVSREWEGRICVFPAMLMHLVNPFYTSDQYRISISGNLIPTSSLEIKVM